ncbi:unnamed protein product [Symbiodinium sp. CCMP2592]|nr:unnamed protein product [Symbiodinium sp. CCMP2592]
MCQTFGHSFSRPQRNEASSTPQNSPQRLCILVRHLRQRAVDRQFLPEADAVLQAFEDEARRQGSAMESGKARHRKLDRHLAKLKFGALASLATYQDTTSSFYWTVQAGLDKLRKDLDSKY